MKRKISIRWDPSESRLRHESAQPAPATTSNFIDRKCPLDGFQFRNSYRENDAGVVFNKVPFLEFSNSVALGGFESTAAIRAAGAGNAVKLNRPRITAQHLINRKYFSLNRFAPTSSTKFIFPNSPKDTQHWPGASRILGWRRYPVKPL